MSFSMPQAVADALYQTSGWVLVHKGQPHDPLSTSGFLAWEGEFADQLIQATAPEREELAALAGLAIDSINPEQESESYREEALAALLLLLLGWGGKIRSQIDSKTQVQMLDIAQASVDGWGALHVGPLRNLSDSESNWIRQLARGPGFGVSDYFGVRFPQQVRNRLNVLIPAGARPADHTEGLRIAVVEMIQETAQYWPTYATNSLMLGRSYGSLAQFARGGVGEFVYDNPLDEFTTPFCNLIAGNTVSVPSALDQMYALAQANSFEEIRELAPLVRAGANEGEFIVSRGVNDVILTADNVEQMMRQLGLFVPPFHHRCRTLLLPVTDI